MMKLQDLIARGFTEKQAEELLKNGEYWKERVSLLEQSQHANATQYVNEISNIYDSATREIEKELTKWYTRYANEEGITLTEAKRLLNTRELAEFRMDVNEYIKKGQSLDPKWAKQLEGASVKVHISRLEALKVQTQQMAERVKGQVADSFDEFAVKTYSEQYYKTIFELQKGAGIGFDIAKLDEKELKKVINKPWAIDGKNFSSRIWGDRTKLVNELHQTISKGVIQGTPPHKIAKELHKRMDVSKSATSRLVYTESAFFNNQAMLDGYKELGVEEYEVVATLDTSTSPICRKMDGQTFKINEIEVGVNFPPFHVYCRTTTVPFFDDEFTKDNKRIARGEDGKCYEVPTSMKYPEWFKTFVLGGSKNGLVELSKLAFESKMTELKGELNQSYEELETKQKEIKTLNYEIHDLTKDIKSLEDQKDNVIDGKLKSAFEKYKQSKGLDIDKALDESKSKLKEVSEKYDALMKKHDLYYNRGDMDRVEWREWRNSFDFNDLFDELMETQKKKGVLEQEIVDLENIKSFKSKFDQAEKKLLQIDEDIVSKSKEIDLKKETLVKTKDSIAPLETQIEEKTRNAGKLFIENMDTGDFRNHVTEYRKVVDETKRLAKEATEAGEQYKQAKITYSEYLKKYDAWKISHTKMTNLKSEIVPKNIEVLKNNLEKIRPMGIPDGMEKELNVHLGIKSKASLTDARKSVLKAYDCYPTEWIENSLKHSNLQIAKTKRGYYNHYGSTLKTSGDTIDDLVETSIHELGHRFEHTQGILNFEKTFYNRRTEGESLTWIGGGYDKSELTKKDNFLNPYIGKDYGGSAYEVVSMGFQYAYTDLDLLLKDEDFAQFIFGLLATR